MAKEFEASRMGSSSVVRDDDELLANVERHVADAHRDLLVSTQTRRLGRATVRTAENPWSPAWPRSGVSATDGLPLHGLSRPGFQQLDVRPL